MTHFAFPVQHRLASQLLTIHSGTAVRLPVDRDGFLSAAEFVQQPDAPRKIAAFAGETGDEYKNWQRGLQRFADPWIHSVEIPERLRQRVLRSERFSVHEALSAIGMFLCSHANGQNVFPDPTLFFMPPDGERFFTDSAYMMEEAVVGLLAPLIRGASPHVLLLGPGPIFWPDLHHARRFLDRLSSVALRPAHLDIFEILDPFDIGKFAGTCEEIDWGQHTYSLHIGGVDGDYSKAGNAQAHFILHLHPFTNDGDLMFDYFRHLVPGGLALLQGDALGDDLFSSFSKLCEPYLKPRVTMRWEEMLITETSRASRVVPGVVLLERMGHPIEEARRDLMTRRYEVLLEL